MRIAMMMPHGDTAEANRAAETTMTTDAAPADQAAEDLVVDRAVSPSQEMKATNVNAADLARATTRRRRSAPVC